MRIFITTNFSYWGAFNPASLFEPSKRQIAGGETAMLHLAFQLARLGHEVLVFYGTERPVRYRGVDFLPKSYAADLLPVFKGDVLLSWEDKEAIAWNHTCDLTVFAMQTNAIFMGVLDTGVDWYQAVSKWHVETLVSSDSTLPPNIRGKFRIFPNGVDLGRYAERPERVPYRIIYSSSPDRGLHHLLRMWPDIKREVPEAELYVFYDMEKWLSIVDAEDAKGNVLNTTERAHLVRDGLKATADQGVHYMGPVGQHQLAQEQMKASLMCYPCDSVDKRTEGFGISILEALAAGTPVLTSDGDAFGEVWHDVTRQIPLPLEGKEVLWVRAIKELLNDGKKWEAASRRGLRKAATLTWDKIGKEYVLWLQQALAEKKGSSP